MRAITLHQPWASLIALGVKRVETRSWAPGPDVIGAPLAIAAASRIPPYARELFRAGDDAHEAERLPLLEPLGAAGFEWTWNGERLATNVVQGCVVATCVVAAVLPMVVAVDEVDFEPCVVVGDGTLDLWSPSEHDPREGLIADIRDQLPFGHWAPGRFAWLLDEVAPVDPPVPAKGNQGFWNWHAAHHGARPRHVPAPR